MNGSQFRQVADEYAAARGNRILKTLGFGQDGHVFLSHSNTAIKVFARLSNFELEVECYERFLDYDVHAIREFAVPRLRGYDRNLMVIEMSLVEPPFILDYGKVYLDRKPDFSAEVLEDWEADYAERWGSEWVKVQLVLHALRRYGIFYMDPKPGNIAMRDWNPPE
jgi:hypothetical protein